MRKISYRVLLPVVFGIIAVILMAWDVRVMRKCIFYDSGLPFWPCETPQFLLTALNLPTLVLTRPLVNVIAVISGIAGYKFEYFVQLPIILLWWWFVGTRADFGLITADHSKRKKIWICGLGLLSSVLLGLLGWAVWEVWIELKIDAHEHSLDRVGLALLLRTITVPLWLAILSYGAGLSIFRITRGGTWESIGRLATLRQFRITTLILIAYGTICTGLVLHGESKERKLQAEENAASMIVTGKIVDDMGRSIKGVRVDLVPIEKANDGTHLSGPYAWTDEHGNYFLRPDTSGDYLLAVMWEQAPSPSEPFLTRFYPDTPNDQQAEILSITPTLHRTLSTIKLHRIDLVHVPISVFWSNGQPAPSASILIQNLLFSHEAGIGSMSMFPEKDGTLAIPVGFDYRAIASVTCDGEKMLTNPYTPAVNFTTKAGAAPASSMRLVLPGEPCNLWHPK